MTLVAFFDSKDAMQDDFLPDVKVGNGILYVRYCVEASNTKKIPRQVFRSMITATR